MRWNESSQVLISNALKPAEVEEVTLCFELGRATIIVRDDQLSLAIGRRGQNVRLAARLTGWDVDILTPPEFQKGLAILEETVRPIEGITDEMLDKLGALGLISVFDVEEVGPEILETNLGIGPELADLIVTTCIDKAKIVAEQQEQEKTAAEQLAAQEGAAADVLLGSAPAVEVDQSAEAAADDILGGKH